MAEGVSVQWHCRELDLTFPLLPANFQCLHFVHYMVTFIVTLPWKAWWAAPTPHQQNKLVMGSYGSHGVHYKKIWRNNTVIKYKYSINILKLTFLWLYFVITYKKTLVWLTLLNTQSVYDCLLTVKGNCFATLLCKKIYATHFNFFFFPFLSWWHAVLPHAEKIQADTCSLFV